MARIDRIRNNGAIPERRHDAFLLALLLAVAINIAFFAVQAILPTLAHLLRLLGPEPALQQQEEEQMPFVLVDPSFLDEEVTPDAAAESFLNRDARQTQETDLPEDQPFIEEGVEEILSPPEGSMGPELGTHDAPETPESGAQPTEEVEARQQDETAGEDVPAAIYDDTPEPAPEEESPAEPEPLPPEPEPLPEPPAEPVPPEPPPPEAPPPEPEPVPEPVPEPPPEPFIPPPPAEVPPEPIPEPEPVPDPPMEPPPEPEPEAPPPEEMLPEPLPPEPEPQPDPVAEMIDLASLPTSSEGLFDPQRDLREELARQSQPLVLPPPPQYREPPRDILPPQPQAFQTPQQPVQPTPQPHEQPRERTGRRQPTFRRIGGASSAASTPSVSGGSPSRVNRRTGVNLLDSDPNMKLLEHRYGQYMRQVARLLQESLNREVMLNPTYYTRGQAKIFFSIAPDGSLAYYDTAYPAPGELDYVRLTSERTVVNAGPFEKPTQAMLDDPLFRRMSVTVNLY